MSNETLLQIPVTMDGHRSMMAGSVKLTFESQENTPPETLSRILSLNKKHGWLAFLVSDKDTPAIKPEVIDTGLPLPPHKKGSISQQLYKQMFHFYMAKNDSEEGFNAWREQEIARLTDDYRQRAFEAKEDNSG